MAEDAPRSHKEEPASKTAEQGGLLEWVFEQQRASINAVNNAAASQRKELEAPLAPPDRFSDVKGMTPEALAFARAAINSSLNEMKTNPKVAPKLNLAAKGIVLKDADYYIALAIKESTLKPKAISRSDARGLFQLKSVALKEVNQQFGLNMKTENIFYDGDDPAKLAIASAGNAAIGILYWHICRDVYPKKIGLKIPEPDKEKAATFSYKMGPSAFSNLWKTINPTSMDDFEKRLAAIIAAKAPQSFTRPKSGSEKVHNTVYDIDCTSFIAEAKKPAAPASPKAKPTKKPAIKPAPATASSTIKIGSFNYNLADLVETIRYVEVIHALRTLPEKEAQAPTASLSFDVIDPPKRMMWSIAKGILEKVNKEYKIPFFKDPTKTNSLKIRFLIGLTIQYNNYVGNPFFIDVDPDDESPALVKDSIVYFPTQEYIEKAIAKSAQEVPPPPSEKIETPLAAGSLYCGAEAAKLESASKEVLKYAGKNPPFEFVIPSYKGVPLDVKLPSRFGVMASKDVKYVVLHATEGLMQSDSRLYRTKGAHYLVRQDGTVESLRNEDIAIDHAGRWATKGGSMAMWEGDENVTLHSIGIEVETKPNEGYNPVQYTTLKTLVAWIGSRYAVKKGNVVAHSMIGVTDVSSSKWVKKEDPDNRKYVRGRKQDPRNLAWSKLGLPNNYMRIDPDVASGRVGSNISRIKDEISGKASGGWNQGTSLSMLPGLEAADQICIEAEKTAKKAAKEKAKKNR